MKESTSFRLSSETIDALKELSERYKVSQAAVLEHLILDRYLASDKRLSAQRRSEALKDARLTCETDTEMFHAGFRAGWYGFQTRHGVDKLIEPID